MATPHFASVKPWPRRVGCLLLYFGVPNAFAIEAVVLWYKSASWSVKHICFVRFHFFHLFFSAWSSFKKHANNSICLASARLVLMKWPLVRKPHYLHGFRDHFFKEAALGRPKVCNCRQTHFFKKHFYFLRKMSLTPLSHLRPLGPSPGGVESGFSLKKTTQSTLFVSF